MTPHATPSSHFTRDVHPSWYGKGEVNIGRGVPVLAEACNSNDGNEDTSQAKAGLKQVRQESWLPHKRSALRL